MKEEKEHHPFIPYEAKQLTSKAALKNSFNFFEDINKRRSVRDFSPKAIDKDIIENIVRTAATAPSGANKQPVSYCVISNPVIKKSIRIAAEKEEYLNYHGRMPASWIRDLAPLGTDWKKPFLETAPWLIVMFKKSYEIVNGEKRKLYYVNESVGIAAGFLIAAIHQAGLVTLTHTPSPMNFLEKILNRPENERAYLLLPVGFPAKDALVPDIKRKPFDEMTVYFE